MGDAVSDDILVRLRRYTAGVDEYVTRSGQKLGRTHPWVLGAQAADEIDRLTRELADCQAEHAAFSNNVEQCEAENDRLRRELAEARCELTEAKVDHPHQRRAR